MARLSIHASMGALVLASCAVQAGEEPGCTSDDGQCIVTGYYDYDPKQIEVDILVEPRTRDVLTTTITLPNGRKRRQFWEISSQDSACQTTRQCENGAQLSCYAAAPCGGGETGDSLWCGQFVAGAPDTLLGAVHLCNPLTEDDPIDEEIPGPGPNGRLFRPGDSPGGQPAPLPPGNPPEGGPPPGATPPGCSAEEFRARNIESGAPFVLQIEDRTPTRKRQYTTLGPGGYPSFTTVTSDSDVLDIVNTVHAETAELRHFRYQGRQLLTQLSGMGWVLVPGHLAGGIGMSLDDAKPATFAQQVSWDDYIGRTRCPRSTSDTEANECLVFRNDAEDMFFVHRQSCRLEHVDTRNDNGPVTVEVYWLNGSFRFEHVTPDRVMSGGMTADQDLFEKLSTGAGAVDHEFHTTRDFKSAGLAER